MSKKATKAVVKYKPLFADSDSAFKTERSLDTMIFSGSYLVEITHNGADVGLPIEDCGEVHYIVGTLVVTESGTDGPKQKKRVIGQVLTITSRENKETKVYSRTFADGSWGAWRSLVNSGMYDNITTTDELVASVGELSLKMKTLLGNDKDSINEKIQKAEEDILHRESYIESEEMLLDKIFCYININGIFSEVTIQGVPTKEAFVNLDKSFTFYKWENGKSVTIRFYLSDSIYNNGNVYCLLNDNGMIIVNLEYSFPVSSSSKTNYRLKPICFIPKNVEKELALLDSKITRLGFTTGVVELDTVNKKLKIPKGCYVIGSKLQQLLQDDIFVVPNNTYGTHYIILDCSTLSARTVDATAMITYSNNEALFGLVRWTEGFVWFNSTMQRLNGVLLDYRNTPKADAADVLSMQEKIKTVNNGRIFSAIDNNTYFTFEVEQFSMLNIELIDASGNITVYFYNDNSLTGSAKFVSGGERKISYLVTKTSNRIRLSDSTGGKYKEVNIQTIENADILNLQEHPKVTCMFNPRADLRKDNLKVFDIGNSYTQDAHTYIKQLLQAAGIVDTGFSLYKAVRGSASFNTWLSCYNDEDTALYTISHTAGDVIDGIAGEGKAGDGSLFRNALSSVDWDIIIIHPVSTYASYYNAWQTSEYYGNLPKFIQTIRTTNPQACIGWLGVHSYKRNYSCNVEGSTLLRWKKIADATKLLSVNYGIDFIVPYGTAVENLRASSLNDGEDFSTDGTHLATGLGDYVASCCYFQSLFAPRFGISVIGNTFRVNVDETIVGQRSITDETASVAQKAAVLATYNMYEVVNPEVN